jgi:hypothetical protein
MEVVKLAQSQKIFLDMLSQIFELEKKAEKIQEANSLNRNIKRLREMFTELYPDSNAGFSYHNPIGEKYDHTRIDCDASIAGETDENLVIIEVIKPIIRFHQEDRTHIVQKALVVVSAKIEEKTEAQAEEAAPEISSEN